MKKILYTLICIALGTGTALAQSDLDALRFSQDDGLGSSARSLGLAGSLGAVGADPASVLMNPAGLAQYKQSSLNFSLGSNSLRTRSDYNNGSTLTSNVVKPQIPGVNLVATERRFDDGNPAKKGWVNYNVLIGWNKTADYKTSRSYKGWSTHSMTDYVADYVQGLDASALDANNEQLNYGFYYFENMFWYAYLIDSVSNGQYAANYDPMLNNFQQAGRIITDGGMNEFNLALAGNYSHKVYFGASLNIHSVRYDERNVFEEQNDVREISSWDYYKFSRDLSTSGVGFSGRFGMIIRPNDQLRIGATIHTPKVLNLTDSYSDELAVRYHDGSSEDLNTIDKEFNYLVTTPMKYSAQLSYFFGKQGFLSAELESIDYRTMYLSSDQELFESVNDNISNQYNSAINVKVGGEYAVESFRFRAGIASFGSALSTGDHRRNVISGGMGIHERNWSFDVGLAKAFITDEYIPYNASGLAPNIVTSNSNGTQLMISVANKF